jgi:anti-sigma regulatory factor (Ser/Thr protein kinase)
VEVIVQFGSTRLAIDESSQTAEARRIARRLALEIGLDANDAERVAITVTEACTNLLKHATRGELLLSVTPDAPLELELLALDRGPGIANLEKCLRDGYSTGGSAGQGLGAITRLSDASDFYTVAGQGTALLARWTSPVGLADRQRSRHELRTGMVNTCKPGQEVCGDSWGVERVEHLTTVLVADGLGHGPEANAASLEAVRMLHLNPELSPLALIERCHHALRSTRGAAVSVARIDRLDNKVHFCGVGNVAAQVYSGAILSQHLVSVNGTAGHQMQRLHEFSYPWPVDGMLIVHSDGLSTSTNAESRPGLVLRDPTLIAGVLYRDFSRGNDDSTIVVTKEA